ncbi:MAG: BamA/TamA family outer membrane protein [Urechidicola sp.]|nr:BamA/TamA family outer membrane protein [Urechidicola sp.]
MKQRLVLVFSIFSFLLSQAQNDSIPKKDKSLTLVAIPVVNYSNSFGASFGGLGTGFYQFKKKDTVSPLSSSSVFGMYSTNNTWFAAQINKLYINEDKIRVKTALGLGTINFQTFVDWPGFVDIPIGNINSTDDGTFIDYTTNVQFVFAEFLHRVMANFYAGAQAVYSHSKTEFDVITNPTEEISQFGFGFATEFDSRDNQLAPLNGKHAKFNTMSFFESLGSTNSYSKINMVYNHYFQMSERNVLLARFYSDISFGDVPFSGQNIVGRDDLRGYSEGKYRGDQVYAAQSEYRHWFAERWGYVAFGGVATAINTANDLIFNNLLPAAGAGIRFLAIPNKKISIGIDVAVGKDDWGLYFRIGEAFTR